MGIIGNAFVGLTRVYGVGRDRKIIDIPESGLVAWYDPSDYTAGTTTWEDRSNNYLDLTLSSTTSKSGNYVVMNGITGISQFGDGGTTDYSTFEADGTFRS